MLGGDVPARNRARRGNEQQSFRERAEYRLELLRALRRDGGKRRNLLPRRHLFRHVRLLKEYELMVRHSGGKWDDHFVPVDGAPLGMREGKSLTGIGDAGRRDLP